MAALTLRDCPRDCHCIVRKVMGYPLGDRRDQVSADCGTATATSEIQGGGGGTATRRQVSDSWQGR